MQRKRVTEVQTKILIEAMEKNPGLQACKFTSQYTIKHKARDWKELVNQLNQSGKVQKTVLQWQKCWTGIKSRKKKNFLAGDTRVDGRTISIMKACAAGDTKCQENQSTTENGKDLPFEDVDLEDNTNSTVFNQPISHSTPNKENQTLSDQTETKGVDLPCGFMDSGTNTDSSTVHNLPKSHSTPNSDIQTLSDQMETKGVVLDKTNCEKLIAAEEASGTAMNAIASHLKELVKVKNRNAITNERSVCAIERIACAFERIANSLEKVSDSLSSI